MVPAARWLVVALLALAVSAPPAVLRFRPAADSDIGAVELAHRVQTSTSLAWTGEVRAQGSLDLPLGGSMFGGVERILGARTELRVWWRKSTRWRIDRLRTTGETDQLRENNVTIKWNYEAGTARIVSYSPIREPDDNDIVPAPLAVRMFAGAKPSELSRLPARRVVGRSAVGLRLVPSDAMSTIGRVDTWVDESSGVPLRVDVYGDDDSRHPVFTSEVSSFDADGPTDRQISFEFSPEADFERAPSLDAVASANAFAPFVLPSQVIGLDRRGADSGLGAVGVYGRGPTAILAVPLRGEVAHELHDQLVRNRRAKDTGGNVALEVGPLSVLLRQSDQGNFLLTGTISPEALLQAGIELQRGAVRTR
jgi:hypothetical protein